MVQRGSTWCLLLGVEPLVFGWKCCRHGTKTAVALSAQALELQAGADRAHMQQQHHQGPQQPATASDNTGAGQGASVDALARQLEQSQQELRAALAAAAEAQQEARQLRRQLSTRCVAVWTAYMLLGAAQHAWHATFASCRPTVDCCKCVCACRQPVTNGSASSPFAKAAAEGSASRASSSGAAAAASREAKLAAENKDLVEKLAATHQKLKQLRARSQQRESVQQAQVRKERSSSCGRDWQVSKDQPLLLCVHCAHAGVPAARAGRESLTLRQPGWVSDQLCRRCV